MLGCSTGTGPPPARAPEGRPRRSGTLFRFYNNLLTLTFLAHLGKGIFRLCTKVL